MTSFLLLAASCFLTPNPLAPNPSGPGSTGTESALLAPVFVAPAFDDGSWHGGGSYLRLMGGLMTMADSDGPAEDIEFDEGYLLAAAFGQRLTDGDRPLNFDLELEGVWTDTDADSTGTLQAISDVSTLGAFLNGMVDLRLADRFSIYGGAGIGAAWMDVGTESDALNDFNDEDGPFLAWQAKAGVMWRTSQDIAIVLGYRFINVDDNEVDDGIGGASFDLQTEQHVIEVGLRFGF